MAHLTSAFFSSVRHSGRRRAGKLTVSGGVKTTELFTPASPPRQLRLQTEPESEQKSPKSSSCQLHLTLTGHDPSRITLADDLGAPPPESANRQPKWDPFERYWSKANSFPDYGRQPPNGTMLSRLKAIIPGYIPINTLSGRAHKDSNDMPPKSAATQTEESDHYPRPKRRKTSHNPGDDIVELEHAPGNSSRARSERRGSPSTASGSNSRTGPGIDEFRRLDGIASPNRKKRPRHKPGGFTSALKPNARLTSIRPTDARLEPIEDSGEDDLAGDGRPQKNKKIRSAMYDTRPHSQNVFRVPSGSESDDQISVQETGSSASKLPTRRTRVATQSLAARRKQTGEDIDASEDELQIKSRPSAPRTRVKPVDLTLSSSDKATVTSRADIKPTEFVKQAGNAPPGGNLRATVTKAFCVPTFVYPESPGAGPDAYDQPCELVVEPEFSRKLIPIGPDGKPIPQLLWLRVTLGNRVQSISYCPSSAILKLRQRIQPSTDGAGALLMIKFASPDVARQVIRWAEQIENYGEANIDLWEIQESELQKTWDNKLNEIIHNKERRPSMPDDVKLLEHNEAARMKRPPGATIAKADPSLPAARSFLRHNMKPGEPSTVEETSFLSDIVEDARLGRRFGRTRAATRSSQPLVREPSPVLVAWTEQNRDWAKDWRVDLCYRRTTISKDDIVRLDEGQFLNDSIITFYLKYLHGKLEEENKALADKVYIFNSFFYEKLTAKKGRGINYEGVQSWTAKTDLLAHDYIVVPINEASHWWVAIICNASAILPSSAVKDEVKIEETLHSRPSGDFASDSLDGGELGGPDESHPKGHTSRLPAVTRTMSHISINSDVDNDGDVEGEVVEDSVNRENAVDLSRSSDAGREESNSDVGATDNIKTSRSSKKRTAPVRKYDPKQPRIVTLDSLGSPHSAVSTNLRAYLMAEIKHKKNIEIEDPGPMGMTVRDIPLQDNFTDCGVYLLGYIREFMKNPDRFASDVLRKVPRTWDINSSALRNEVRELIFQLQRASQVEHDADRRKKAQAKRSKERQEGGGARSTSTELPNRRSDASSRPSSAAESATRPSSSRSKSSSKDTGAIKPSSDREPDSPVEAIAMDRPTSLAGTSTPRRRSPTSGSEAQVILTVDNDSEPKQSAVPLPSNEHHAEDDIRPSIEVTDEIESIGSTDVRRHDSSKPKKVGPPFEERQFLPPLSSSPARSSPAKKGAAHIHTPGATRHQHFGSVQSTIEGVRRRPVDAPSSPGPRSTSGNARTHNSSSPAHGANSRGSSPFLNRPGRVRSAVLKDRDRETIDLTD